LIEQVWVTRDRIITATDLRTLTDTPAYQVAYEGDRYISPMIIDPQHRRPYITVSEPVEKFPGEITGILIAEIDLTDIWDLVALTDLGEDSQGYLYVVDAKNNRLIAHSERQNVFIGDDPIALDLTDRLQGHSTSSYMTIGGEEFLISSVHNLALDWVIVAVEPTHTALASVANQRDLLLDNFTSLIETLQGATLIVSVGILVSALILSMIGAHRILFYMNELVSGTQFVAEGDLSYRLESHGYKEARDLANAFNHMIEVLHTTQESLAEERNLLFTIIETAHDFIYAKDVEGRYLITNPVHAQSLGKASVDDVIGKTNAEIHSSELAALFNADEQGIFQTGQPIVNKEETRLNSDGDIIWSITTKVPLKDEANNIVGLVGITRDITQRKEAAEQRLKLTMEKERVRILTNFVEKASHEFRTPLSIIKSGIYALNRDPVSEKHQKRLTRMDGAVNNITRLVEDLVTMSNLDGMTQLDYAPVQINQIINQVVSGLEDSISNKELSVELALSENLPLFSADELYLNLALKNIVGNAVRYTSPNDKIVLRTTIEEQVIIIEVSDTGIGLNDEQKQHIFERFYRGNAAHTTRGFGLGLPIAQKIIELHHGRIEVESMLGDGSTFKIVLQSDE
jgi:PAS domain S-box-containing protein